MCPHPLAALHGLNVTMESRSNTVCNAGSAAEEYDTVAGMIARAMAALDQPHPTLPGQYTTGAGGVQVQSLPLYESSAIAGAANLPGLPAGSGFKFKSVHI